VSQARSAVVVVDTMVMSALVNAAYRPARAAAYRSVIDGRPVMISFATVTELRYGALKAGWGELRLHGLERDLARVVIVQPDDQLMELCAGLRTDCERAGLALGQKVHEADRWIASTAMRLGVELISDDGAFQNVPGLVVQSRTT
jgi:tRNA(fMet)-specific endonuclease VapC